MRLILAPRTGCSKSEEDLSIFHQAPPGAVHENNSNRIIPGLKAAEQENNDLCKEGPIKKRHSKAIIIIMFRYSLNRTEFRYGLGLHTYAVYTYKYVYIYI